MLFQALQHTSFLKGLLLSDKKTLYLQNVLTEIVLALPQSNVIKRIVFARFFTTHRNTFTLKPKQYHQISSYKVFISHEHMCMYVTKGIYAASRSASSPAADIFL